ncbi:MAG: hypothetical protein A2Y45_07010 [Tenericutes bacterium GWC2_34_14]|nr:MAG: hypothetical protein A2Z84_05520 [Tenericutes bacterium GWA2_35_7]OHE28693.1 MAG: hypothetical protein A2Y45_07010 [Tenericutes bacterium GWC2_34_14]OHE33382.1 MAG: hypothetical protein A2012_10330 [Tenericutes bacterium GWE2_34_108]OHE36683.1 MAG: hypothetical protein A2Y46_08605 [Tenericutes bacterium GWF1_35_14]OHE38237.1 MAG: hypothetical protein A2Y44_10060 [Tenericutes bacterium GWF2_35_184]OHE44944.1 MAG: hypothetical protein A2221_04970 [Tenericutes bacterium RIFOXYA2_FULL_36_3
MKANLVIYDENHQVIFEGKALDLPIKMDAIKAKSMELFSDPDPCIIHQSYAISKLITPLVAKLKKNVEMSARDLAIDLSWIEMKDIEKCTFFLKG